MLPRNFFRGFIGGLGSLALAFVLVGCSITSTTPATANPQQKQALAGKDSGATEQGYFEGTFQDGTTAGWNTKRHVGSKKYLNDPDHYSFQIVKDQWSDDEFAGRFEIRQQDQRIGGGWRSELKENYVPLPGDRVWYSFEFLLPEDFINREKSVVIAQWHDEKPDNIPCQRPQLSMRIVAGDLHVYLWHDLMWDFSCARREAGEGPGLLIFSSPIGRERWNKVEVEVVWSAGDDGLIDLKLNGRDVLAYQGPTTYKKDIYGPYFKFGLYTVHPFADPMVIYHKNYKRRVLKSAPQSKILQSKRDRWVSRSFYLEAA